MYLEIPEGSIEIQTGLYLHERTFTVSGVTRTAYELFSGEGYAFYDLEQPENYDEEGNLKPSNELVYMRYAKTPVNVNLDSYVSVPIEEGFEII